MLVHHQVLYPGQGLPAPTGLYDYVLAQNGVFVHTQRVEFSALLPLTPCAIRGLAPLTPTFQLAVPRVPAWLLEELLCRARAARSAGGVPLEILFHLAWTDGWTLTLPPQWGTPTRVHVLAAASGTAPLIEVHSHHALPAFWSATDDADEVGLALYAVLGRIYDQPQLCVRLGIYGQWWPLPASAVFELPATIQDTYAGEWSPPPQETAMPKRLALDFLEARPVRVPAWSRLHLALVGAGGTGSWLLPHLVRLAHLVQTGGRTVTLGISDPDTVAPANVARQNFLPGDVGQAKARVLAARYGLAYGLEVAAWVEPFRYTHLHDTYRADTLTVLLGAVDNAAARTSIAEYVTRTEGRPDLPRCWWIDSGNSYQSGQVCLGNTATLPALRGAFHTPGYCNRLPLPALLHPDLLVPRPEEETTARLSCAELTAAHAQSLLVNTTAATIAADFVYRLVWTGDLKKFATYFDLASGTTRSVYITPDSLCRALGQTRRFFRAPSAPPA